MSKEKKVYPFEEVAIILSYLPYETSKTILANFEKNEVKYIAEKIAMLNTVDSEVLSEIVGKFFYVIYGDEIKKYSVLEDAVFGLDNHIDRATEYLRRLLNRFEW